ncbi:MAG: hypothetical protein SFU86_08410 [Pirellulaceae bacterium]|nr:hypothetical protein [Pirellulaceae bacterium]
MPRLLVGPLDRGWNLLRALALGGFVSEFTRIFRRDSFDPELAGLRTIFRVFVATERVFAPGNREAPGPATESIQQDY